MASVTVSPSSASGSGWSVATRVTTDDGVATRLSIASKSYSSYLTVNFAALGLSATDVIDGIEVRIDRWDSGGYLSTDNLSVESSSTKSGARRSWTGSEATETFGGPTDLWGLPSSPSAFLSSWSLQFRVYNDRSYSVTANVDYVSVTIYYHAGTVEVNADRSLSWSVRTPVNADRSLSWAVRTSVTADRSLSWSVRSAITADRSLSWAVRQSVAADRALAWSVRQAIATDRDLAWAVRQLVDVDRVLLWDVEPAVGVVVVDRGLSWDIRAIVSADRAVSWDVRALTAADSVLLWDVRELAEADRDLAWDIQEIVEADRELVWRVRTNAIIRQITVHGSARAAQVVSGAPHVLAASGSLHVMPAVSGSLREGISATGSARQPVIVKGSPA